METVGFAYGQRHAVELECRAPDPRRAWRSLGGPARRGPRAGHRRRPGALGETALTGGRAIAMGAEGLPNTFVPGRNLLFLTYAAALAYRRGLRRIVGGMCETDYSRLPGLPRRHHQGDAAGAEPRHAAGASCWRRR